MMPSKRDSKSNKTFLVSSIVAEQLISSGLEDNSITIKRTSLEKTRYLKSIIKSDGGTTAISLGSEGESNFGSRDDLSLQILSPLPLIQIQHEEEMYTIVCPKSLDEKRFFSKNELVHLVTNPDFYNEKLYSVMTNTYQWFMSEKELFEILICRFYPPKPPNLSSSESKQYMKSRKNIQMKVMIFIGRWFRKYKDIIITVEELQTIFRELVYIIFKNSTVNEAWVFSHLKEILNKLEISSKVKLDNALRNWEQQIFQRNRDLNTYKIPKNRIPEGILSHFELIFRSLSKEPEILCQQICEMDFENFKSVHPNEMIDSNWTKKESQLLSPNIVYICEVFNRLSKLFTFFVMCHPKKRKQMNKRVEWVVNLAHLLLLNRNFNSAYSVYLSLRNVWLKNYMDLHAKKIKLGSSTLKKLEILKDIFKVDKRQKRLREEQIKSKFPSIPFMGVYLQQILFLGEIEKTFNKEGLVNYKKFKQVNDIMERVLNMKQYPYSFKKSKGIIKLMGSLPNAGDMEDYIAEVYQTLIRSK